MRTTPPTPRHTFFHPPQPVVFSPHPALQNPTQSNAIERIQRFLFPGGKHEPLRGRLAFPGLTTHLGGPPFAQLLQFLNNSLPQQTSILNKRMVY